MITHLKHGDIIRVRDAIIEKCAKHKHRSNLMYGLGGQFEHTAQMRERGFDVEEFNDTYPIDRVLKINGRKSYQDDKIALYSEKLRGPAHTHTIGMTEGPFWRNLLRNGDDVIIHSFEQFDKNDLWSFRYAGAYSFGKLCINESKFDSSEFFWRAANVKYSD